MFIDTQNIVQGNSIVRESLHQPVMVSEVISILCKNHNGIFLDCTLGLGGHAGAILNSTGPDGTVIGIDCDEESLEIARRNLMKYKDRFIAVYGNFKDADKIVKELNVNMFDGILLDLGLSSFQLSKSERGFSFMKEGPLDMRMDRNSSITAEEIVNNYKIDELERILREYGEERYARRIARRIGEIRRKKPIRKISELVNIINSVIPARMRKRYGHIHPATRTFQALRIAVNQELGNLKQFFSFAIKILKKGGRLAIISFHSLEDRLVKLTFRRWEKEGYFTILTKKVILPSEQEILSNPRARSAKLRAGERIL